MKKYPTTAEIFCFYVITLCFAFFGYIVIMSYNTKQGLPQEAGMIMAAVISIATGVSGFIIGSSATSKNKDELISKAMDTTPPTTVKNEQGTVNITTSKEETKL